MRRPTRESATPRYQAHRDGDRLWVRCQLSDATFAEYADNRQILGMYHHLDPRLIPQPQQKSEDSLSLLAVLSLELDGKFPGRRHYMLVI